MSSRITKNDDLKDIVGRTIINRPIIIVEATEDRKQQFRIHLDEIDPMLSEPTLFGILLSDLVDQIADAYAQVLGRNERDIRDHLMRTIRRESSLKDKDPSRGGQSGAMIMPRKS